MSLMETLEEKIRIIENLGFSGSVNFDSLTSFPRLSCLKSLSRQCFWNMMVPVILVPTCAYFVERWHPMETINLCLAKSSRIVWLVLQPHGLRVEKALSLREMYYAFLDFNRFIIEIALDHIDLQRMEKKSEESFWEYAQRWREKATQVQTPPYMTKEEMIKWFLDNLKPPYYENMINVQVPHFANLISIGEPVDEGIISKKTIDLTTLYSLMEQQFKESETWVCAQGICCRCIFMSYYVHSHRGVTVPIHVTKWHWFPHVCDTYQCA